MLFYKIEAIVTNSDIIPDSRDRNNRSDFSANFKESSENFYRRQKENVFIFISNASDKKITLGLISKSPASATEMFWKYINMHHMI